MRRILRRLVARVGGLLRHARTDFEAELQSHLDLHIADNLNMGMTPDQAKRRALVALGGATQARERYRDGIGLTWVDALMKDVLFGLRTMRRHAGFTMLAIVTLAIGIASTNTAFTILNAVMLREMPFDEAHRLLEVGLVDPHDDDISLSYPDFVDWKRSSRMFDGLAAFQTANVNVGDDQIAPERFLGSSISANTFSLLRVQPAMGRDFTADDDHVGAPAVAILSDRIWRRRYDSDPAILGRTIRINAQAVVVVGVMGPSMEFPMNTALWLPIAKNRRLTTEPRDSRNLAVFGRLADGVTVDEAKAELNAIAENLKRDFPETNARTRAQVGKLRPGIGAPLLVIFGALMAAVGLLLMVSCANVANLMLSRGLQRSREVAIRMAMGATRWRVIRQLLIESVVLAACAGLVALALSSIAMRLFMTYSDEIDRPFWMDFSMDASVLMFLCALCLGTGIVFGLAPALHLARAGTSDVRKEAGGRTGTAGVRSQRWSAVFVITEVVLTVVLVAGAVAMIRRLSEEMSVKDQIDSTRVMTMTLRLPVEKYAAPQQWSEFYRRLEERFDGLTNIPALTVASVPPFVRAGRREISLDGRVPSDGDRLPLAEVASVGSRYVETVGLRLLRGRTLHNDDAAAGREGAVVDQLFVDRFLTGREPLGHAITLYANRQSPRRATIVGVVQTLAEPNVAQSAPVVYVPYLSEPTPSIVVLAHLRNEEHASSVASTLREEIRRLDPDLPLFDARTLDELFNWRLWANRVFGGMFVIFAGSAVLIASVGIYGVVAYTTAQRTQEIGIRMTLGASRRHLWWTMTRSKLVQIGVGLTIGIVAAFLLLRLMGGLLVGRFGQDPATLGASAAFLLMVSVVAMVRPVWRATSGSPVAALRYE